MAWIESHQSLERHPKRVDLAARMKWSKPESIGRLHLLWWWVVDFAEDGNLQKYNDAQIAEAMCVDIANSGDLVKALVAARWLERTPYFRVRNWWSYSGRFLQVRYKNSPAKWQEIQRLYADEPIKTPADNPPNNPPKPHNQHNITNQPNQEGARARDGSECFAERPSWGEWWAYLQTQSCLLPAEWYARDKFEAAESDNWNGKSNWKAYARRCKGWWEADGRPMTPKTKNATNGAHTGKQSPSVFNLTKIIEAKKTRCDTLKNKHATETGLDTTWNSVKAREEFVKIRGEIKSLNAQLAGMA